MIQGHENFHQTQIHIVYLLPLFIYGSLVIAVVVFTDKGLKRKG
jgi:hypothetical protein